MTELPSRIYGVSLERSHREVDGKTEYVHELVTEPALPLEVLLEDFYLVRCTMVIIIQFHPATVPLHFQVSDHNP